MATCLVNDRPECTEIRPETWGALLRALDRRLETERRVVTAVRFDGVDQPSFREPEAASRSLAAVGRIEVEAVESGRLLNETLDLARQSLPVLADSARQAARLFRGGATDAGQQQLVPLVQAVQTLLVLTDASAQAGQVDLDAARGRMAQGGRDVFTAMTAALDLVIARQSAQDWTGLATALDTEFAAAVTAWCGVLDAIAEGGLS